MCVDVCECAIGLNITSKLLVIPSQNAPGPGLDPVVPLGKQLDRERIHGKLLRNNLCVSVVCLLLLSSVSHFNSRGISVSSEQNQKSNCTRRLTSSGSFRWLFCLFGYQLFRRLRSALNAPCFLILQTFHWSNKSIKWLISESQNLWQDRENFWFETGGFNSASRIYLIKVTGHVHLWVRGSPAVSH